MEHEYVERSRVYDFESFVINTASREKSGTEESI